MARICIDFKKLNVATKNDPYPLPFTNEMLNIVTRYETYSFLNGYLGYHQIFIAPDDKYKTTFVTNWGGFIWKVMSFGVKNGPLTYQRAVTKTLREYLDNFVKILLDDFMVYNDMESHLQKLKLCFQKCKEYDISLNPDKCAFMVFSRMILGFIISKEGKLPYFLKIQAIVSMPPFKSPQQIQVFNGMAQFYRCFIKNFVFIMALITKLIKKTETFLWTE
jgi:hypothetical protein